jgi:hypothetical protein
MEEYVGWVVEDLSQEHAIMRRMKQGVGRKNAGADIECWAKSEDKA